MGHINQKNLAPACPVIVDQSILKKIGNTPLIHLENISKRYPNVEIYAKAEWRNAGVPSSPALPCR